MTRRVVIIQARMSSTRMPGKVLAELGGLPMIVFMVQRLRKARRVDAVLVATSADASDDPLANVLARHGIECFRGSLHDVLDRYYQAARASGADHVVRLTGDCPLIDADLVDEALGELESGDWDYVSNLDPPTFPDGLSVEAFTLQALETAWRNAQLASEREHVTPYLRKPESGMRRHNVRSDPDRSALRWTVDYPDDLEHVRELVAAVGGKREFDRNDLYQAIEARGIARRVSHDRGEGYAKSLLEDKAGVTRVSVLCSDPKHPVNAWLERWVARRPATERASIVRDRAELRGGDFLFLVSCHQIIDKTVRDQYRHALVLHASDLPKGRGWSPHVWQILEGAQELVVSLLKAEDAVDSGDIWAQERVPLTGTELHDEIHARLFDAELQLMDWALDNCDRGKPRPQIGKPSAYRKRTPADSAIDPARPLTESFDLLRIADPDRYPAHFELRGQKYTIRIEKMKPEGKP